MPASSGNDLSGMIEDIYHYIGDSSVFHLDNLSKTGDLENMIDVICSSYSLNQPFLMGELEDIWINNLSYRDFECHSITQSKKLCILEFITHMSGKCYYVTGSITLVIPIQ